MASPATGTQVYRAHRDAVAGALESPWPTVVAVAIGGAWLIGLGAQLTGHAEHRQRAVPVVGILRIGLAGLVVRIGWMPRVGPA